MIRSTLASLTLALLCVGCTAQAPERPVTESDSQSSGGSAHQAHDAYVTAINSNNLDTLLAVLTDDVVYLSAHEPVMVGKAAVRPWLEAYASGVGSPLELKFLRLFEAYGLAVEKKMPVSAATLEKPISMWCCRCAD